MARRRRFGRIRRLRSGRYQARYLGPDGIDRPAPETFGAKSEAETWLVRKEAEILDDDWLNPDDGAVLFGVFAESWINERPDLRPKTIELYRYLLRHHLAPTFGSKPIAEIKDPQVRRWRAQLLDGGTSPVTTAKAYRLLKAILATAVEDGLLRRNPCRIKGAGQEKSGERPVLTVVQVVTLAEAVAPRYRALVLLGAFTSLRWGELCALRRTDIDLAARTVRVQRALTELQRGGLAFGPPKSDAGTRLVVFPELITPALSGHLANFVAARRTL